MNTYKKNWITKEEEPQQQLVESKKEELPIESQIHDVNMDDCNEDYSPTRQLQEAREKLLLNLGSLRLQLNAPTATNAKILSVIEENPCRLKCACEIKKKNDSNSDFDKLYSSKHDSKKKNNRCYRE